MSTCPSCQLLLSERKQVVLEHFTSVTVVHVNATALYQELAHLFGKHGIPWGNLCSILMDSCAVMRGSKSGLETRIWNDKASHLLGVDGDVCHHIHNSSKKINAPFDNFIDTLFTNSGVRFSKSWKVASRATNLAK